MCKKYINATTSCYKSTTILNNAIHSMNAPFRSIKSRSEDNTLCIDDFVVLTEISFIGTKNKENEFDNPLEQDKKVDFIIRLTKCDKEFENRIGLDLDKFTIDLKEIREKNQVNKACFDFYNYTRIINTGIIKLQGGTGKYVIKVLVKYAEDNDYSIQSIAPLTVL